MGSLPSSIRIEDNNIDQFLQKQKKKKKKTRGSNDNSSITSQGDESVDSEGPPQVSFNETADMQP